MAAKVLWPEREDLYQLMLHRVTIGDAAFECEKQNRPVNPALCEWPSEYFDWPGLYFDEWPKDPAKRVVSLDPSKGRDSRSGDYSAIVNGMVTGEEPNAIYWFDADLQRRPAEKMLADLCKHVSAFGPDEVTIEANMWQDLLEEPLQRIAKSLKVVLPHIDKPENTEKKEVRIRRLGPLFSQRRIRLKRNSPGISILVDEARDFPIGKDDDGLDSMEMCHRRLKPVKKWEVR